VDRLAADVPLRHVARAVEAGLHRGHFSGRLAEVFLGELALGDAVGAPHLVAVDGAHLPGQPGDRRDDEVAVRVDVEQVAHVGLRIADAVLGSQPRRLL